MNFSVSEENYIKSIYHLQQQTATVTTNSLAQRIANQAGFCYRYAEKTDKQKNCWNMKNTGALN